jgi:hypothetical protein
LQGATESAQMNSDWGAPSYGSMSGSSGNMPPIPYSNHVEAVQPETRDYYNAQPAVDDWPINQH